MIVCSGRLWGAMTQGCVGVRPESASPVVQQNARRRLENAAAERREQRIDQRHRVEVAIDRANIHGVLVLGQVPVFGQRGLAGIDAIPDPGGKCIREKPRNRRVALRRVAEIGIAGAIRRLGGLGKKMDTIRLAVPAVPKRQTFDNAQDHEGGEPLSGRRTLVDLMSAIAGFDRLHIIAAMPCEVFLLMQPAGLAQFCGQGLGYLAGVESGCALATDATQGFGKRAVAEEVANLRCATAGEIRGAGCRITRELLDLPAPIPGDARRHPHALLGKADRRRQNLRKRLRSMVPVQRAPRRDRTGYRHRMGRGWRNFTDVPIDIPFGFCRARRTPRTVERDRRRAAHREQCEAVAAYAGHVRLDNSQYGDGGEGSVDRIAARSQHIEAGHGGRRMRRADHAVLANRHRSA